MPLTDFQRGVLSVIAINRSEASHFAGGMVLNAAPDSARFSKDFDFFHDGVEALAASSERDVATLRAAGYEVIPDESYDNGQISSGYLHFRKKIRPLAAEPGGAASMRQHANGWRKDGPRSAGMSRLGLCHSHLHWHALSASARHL